jgi:hypothetical protein
MRKATSRGVPPLRKPKAHRAKRIDDGQPRWSNDDLRRVLALSVFAVIVFGAAWLSLQLTWLLWPVGLSAVGMQISATVISARSAAESRLRAETHQERADHAELTPSPRSRSPTPEPESGESLWSFMDHLLPPAANADSADHAVDDDPSEPVPLPVAVAHLHDQAQHRAFFRVIVEAEFHQHPAGTVWPDLSAIQGSLATRIRLFRRHPASAPVLADDVSESERGPLTQWSHLSALEAPEYRRCDAIARFSHRAFAPMAFLELQERIDLGAEERDEIEGELSRLYTIGYGRILTPRCVLSMVEPMRQRTGGAVAIALADEARLALRSTSTVDEAQRVRTVWNTRARAAREESGWSVEVQSMLEALIDYWLVQRAAAADIESAEAEMRVDGGTVGAALARLDATGRFQFAEMLRLVCGDAPRTDVFNHGEMPTAAATAE